MKSLCKISKTSFIVILFSIFLGTTLTFGQVSLGTDVNSRYVWRGIDFGQSLSYQPSLSYSSGGFEIGTWGSYAISNSAANELDLWVSYSIEINESSSLSLGLTDYFFPAVAGGYFDFNTDGSHVIEPFISYSSSFSITAYLNALNDPDNSIYINASIPFTVDDISLEAFLGFVPSASAWYGTSGAAIQDIGITASKEIPFTDTFSLPISTSFIVNPYTESSFLLFGFSL